MHPQLRHVTYLVLCNSPYCLTVNLPYSYVSQTHGLHECKSVQQIISFTHSTPNCYLIISVIFISSINNNPDASVPLF